MTLVFLKFETKIDVTIDRNEIGIPMISNLHSINFYLVKKYDTTPVLNSPVFVGLGELTFDFK